MTFQQKLDASVLKNNSLLDVGLDSDFDKLPEEFKQKKFPQFDFNIEIIKKTFDLVCAYKLNSAFYEARGDMGVLELKMTCDYIRENYPEIPTIIDAKRGDIGNTNSNYVKFVFDYLSADSVTVIPYLGIEALAPFFERPGKGIIIGCHSSNTGSKEFQELLINGKPLYHIVAEEIMKQYGNNPDCMIFMGATYPEELAPVRKIIGDMTILSPGVGAQAGTIEKTIKSGINSKKSGLIINASRSIIFASNEENFADKAREEAEKLKDEINKYRQ